MESDPRDSSTMVGTVTALASRQPTVMATRTGMGANANAFVDSLLSNPRMLLNEDPDFKYDIFISHLQRNGEEAVLSLRMYLERAHPGIRIFTDLEVDMAKSESEATIRDAVQNSRAFVLFITEGAMQSERCGKELRMAKEFDRIVVLVRETDAHQGAVDMGDVFKQTPEDLVPLLLEIIAIPWYHQPSFRDVSIQSILKAAKVEDAYGKGMRRLAHARRTAKKELDQMSRGGGPSTTAFDVIADHSWAMASVFFAGGFSRFRYRTANAVYVFLFACSFWFCGALCCANIYFQSTPYHVISTDMLTAYVHLPAWQSWYFWHGFVRTDGCAELMTAVMDREHTAKIVRIAVRVAGFIVLFLQISMVSVVLAGFSLPGTLGYSPHAAWAGVLPLPAGGEFFTFVHYVAMWAVIPPVIAAMFASYSMFAFVSLLHWLDVRNLKAMAGECTSVMKSFYQQQAEEAKSSKRQRQTTQNDSSKASSKASSNGDEESSQFSSDQLSAAMSGKLEDLHELRANQEEAEQVFKGVIELLDSLIRRVQARADHSSRAFSALWVHLVLFSTCQVLAIANGLRSHVRDAEGLDGVAYTWWWGFQDFFHLGGGIVLLTTAMVILCSVTTTLQTVPIAILELLRESGCPLSKVGAAHGLLAARPFGMHILFGTVYMDIPKAAGFFLVLLIHVLSTAMTVANLVDC